MKQIVLASILFLHFVGVATNPSHGFIENKGQIHDQSNKPNTDVKFILPMGGMNIQLRSSGFSYDTYKRTSGSQQLSWETVIGVRANKPQNYICSFHRVDVEFVGSAQNAQLFGEKKSADYLNFYGSHMPENGITEVRMYKKVTYKNIYPNIDVEFVSDNENMTKPVEYNFILRPGANLRDIKLKYSGANALQLKNGKLNIKLSHGTLTEAIPLSYWRRSGKKENIHYFILNTNENETIIGYKGLDTPITETLIIDPTPNLDWATYYGDGIDDGSETICHDNLGNVYIGGGTYSSLNIATNGAFQSVNTNTGPPAGFIAKFNRLGVRQWGTFYCANVDGLIFHDITCDKYNNVFTIGETGTPNGMTTPGAYQSSLIGNGDAFLVKFNGAGVRQWATYYGGNEHPIFSNIETGRGLVADTIGNVYITGVTTATVNITTPGVFQTNYVGTGQNGYLAKFNNSGIRQWATYYGGTNDNYVYGICIGNDQNVYVTGTTNAKDSISTPGTYQQYFEPSPHDGYVIKFSATGNRIWGTYYGGNGIEFINSIATDPFGNVVICGTTNSSSNIASLNGYQPFDYGNSFVAKLRSNGQRAWGTYLGWYPFSTTAMGIKCDSVGAVYVTGGTPSATLITTSGSYQQTINGPSDAFIVKYDSTGMLVHGTLYGGNEDDMAKDICVFAQNEIYITGITSSTTGIVTTGAHQTTTNLYAPDYTGFIAKFSNTGAVGVNEFTNSFVDNDLIIYPNPNNGDFFIKCKEQMTLTITDELGELVQIIKYDPTNSERINLLFNSGVYFISATNDNKSLNQKVVVVK